MDTLNISLIGLGYWGINYLRVLLLLNNIKLKYICDKNQKKAEKYSNVAKIVKDPSILAKDKELDAVIIATPASTHYEIAKLMLQAGKHVLIEKPFTMKYSEAEELSQLSRQMNTILMVGHIYCFNPAVNYIREILNTGKLGNLLYGVGLRLGLGPIRNDASCTWDLATHDIAILDYLLAKEPVAVSAHAGSFFQKAKGIYDYANILLYYDQGFTFNLIVSWYAAEKIRTWYLMGSNCMLKFDDMNKTAPLMIFDKKVDLVINEGEGDVTPVPREGGVAIPYIKQEEPLLLEVKHFLECIRDGKKPLTDCEQGLRVVKILELIEESIKRHGQLLEVRS